MAGTAVFATSGALAAARARQTPLAFAFYAVVAGVGGSTLSELLISAPVAWVHDPADIIVCLPCGAANLDHTARLVAALRDRLV
jgi:uncharacterized membrane protein YeiH